MKKKKYFILRKNKKDQEYYEVNRKERILPYERLYLKGYFQNEKIMSALFLLGEWKEEQEIEMIKTLRMADVDFRLINRNEKRYLLILDECNYQEFDKLVEFLVEKIKLTGETLEILTINERIRFLHEGYLLMKEQRRLNIEDYLNNMNECAEDFRLDKMEKKEIHSIIEGENGYFALLGIHSWPDQTDEIRNVVTDLLKSPCFISGIRIFESICDQDVINKMKQCYMGLDGQMVKLKRTDPKFYALYHGLEEDETAHYTFAGCLVLLRGDTMDELIKEVEELQFHVKTEGGKIVHYVTSWKEIWEQIAGITFHDGYTRIITTEKLEGMTAKQKQAKKSGAVFMNHIL